MDRKMKVHLVIASINTLENVKAFEYALSNHECKVIVVDEGETTVRRKNEKVLPNILHDYYGPRKRKEWFKKRFGSASRDMLSVIPERCHAETSFGFLVAYEEKPDIIVEIDDDVFPFEKQSLIDVHVKNLRGNNGVTVNCKGKWYNTIENLKLTESMTLFPRGHPYGTRVRNEDFAWKNTGEKCVLNMG